MRIYEFIVLTLLGLTCVTIIFFKIYPVRANVNWPNTNRYNSLSVRWISIYFNPTDTSQSWL